MDDHDLWEQDENSRQAITRQNQWNDKREKMQTQMELWVLRMSHRKMKAFRICFGQKTGSGTITASFSGVFSVLKEEIEVDPDSFDPVFYSYGMSLYGICL